MSNSDDEASRRSIFVTVGTTLFDPLIDAVSSRDFLSLVSQPEFGGYTDMTIQYGKGRRPRISGIDDGGGKGGMDDGSFDYAVEILPSDETTTEVDEQPPGRLKRTVVRVRGYRFKPSLEADMRYADLIVSHAGAGSIMEGVSLCAEEDQELEAAAETVEESGMMKATETRKKKKLAVVINSRLMDDHQTELADAMGTRGYLHVVPDPSHLLGEEDGMRVLREIEEFEPAPFPGGDEGVFAALLDEHMGFVGSTAEDAKKGQ